MINYDSILSAFDGKPTLLQWLKLIKKALDESVLKDITVSQDGVSAVFTFNFEDGTSISTPDVTLPKGDTGAKGEQGVSVTGVDEVNHEVVGAQTHTTLRFNFSNGTNNEVVVHAENGKNASGGKLYMHEVLIKNTNIYGVPQFSFKCINNSNLNLTKSDLDKVSKTAFDIFLQGNTESVPPKFYIGKQIFVHTNDIALNYFETYPQGSEIASVTIPNYTVTDSVTEL